MKRIITATNDENLNKELKNECNVEVVCKNIQYKEGILEILEKNIKIDYIIIDENLPGEIQIEDLIEEILEKDEKIKIILTIKKENKNNIFFRDEKIIKIFYEGTININKLKNYRSNFNELKSKNYKIKKNKIENSKIINKKVKNNKIINNKKNYNKIKIIKKLKINNLNKYIKLSNKNKERKNKIIAILGEEQVGKSMTIINIAYYLKQKKYKILIVELNKEKSSIFAIMGYKKFNKRHIKRKIKIKEKYKTIQKHLKKIYINEKILKNLIIKKNKNIHLLSYNKLINYKMLKKLEKNYDYLIIEINCNKINNKILENTDEKILLIKPNLIGIKNSKNIIIKNKINKNKNLKIIINNYNKFSIDEKIIKNIFKQNKIIGKILYKKEYDKLINKNFNNLSNKINKNKKEIKKIVDNII